MLLYFGLALDEDGTPLPARATRQEVYLGPNQLIRWLEDRLGLSMPNTDIDFLRTEQYRQALKRHLQDHPAPFYRASFQADDLATADALLSRRDELLGAGWDFQIQEALPDRLRTLAEIEALFQTEPQLSLWPGWADRQAALLQHVPRLVSLIEGIHLIEPLPLLPPYFQRLFNQLEAAGIPISVPKSLAPKQQTDLARFQRFLQDGTPPGELSGDGSLLLLQGFRETHLAAFLAQLIRLNEDLQPHILVPHPTPTLDHAFMMEGLPGLGIPSASLARPSLQVLKLVPVFLWDPIDPYKIMEFVTLTVKPLDDDLAQRIATFLANTPGLYSDRWFAMINQYFEKDLVEKAEKKGELSVDQLKQQFAFWFRRKRVDSTTGKVNKSEVRSIYEYLQQWARQAFREQEQSSLLALANQAQKMVDLLDALPEQELSYLELERIVRTIYEPTPVNYRQAQAQRCPIVFRPGAVIGSVSQLIWWDFIQLEPDYFFSRWYVHEMDFLATLGLFLDQPDEQNARLVWQRKRPILWTQDRLILCQPNFCNGKAVEPHPLLGDLEAAFGKLDAISYHLEKGDPPGSWQLAFTLPNFETEPAHPLSRPEPFLNLSRPMRPLERTETPTSLEKLLYYPYQWVFRHQIKLHQSSILSVLDDNRLFGNLAHRFIENMLRDKGEAHWQRQQVDQWVDQNALSLFQKEGATLLLYGREPERIAFLKNIRYAAWSLIQLIQENGWSVKATEYKLEGSFNGTDILGRADLVLQRGQERAIIDLKWRGSSFYSSVLRNEEDIQLALYAHLLPSDGQIPHTAYYILEQGRMLVRNNQAFADIPPLLDDADHQEIYQQLWQKIERTQAWRQEQLAEGRIEIRCASTQEELEEYYGEDLLELLEMKTENARFDDYQVLIRLVQ